MTCAPLAARTVWGYALGSIGTGIFSTVPSVLLLFFLTDTLGVPAGLAALAVGLPKLWDMAIDPAIGHWSDRSRSRWGRRRPFMLAGALLLAISFVALFSMPANGPVALRFGAALTLFLICSTAYALYAVPYTTLAAELSPSSDERARLISRRMALMMIGTLLGGAGAPAIIEAAGGGSTGYAAMALTLGAVCAISMLASWKLVPDSPVGATKTAEAGVGASLAVLREVHGFAALVLTYLAQLAGLSVFTALLPFLAVHAWGREPASIAPLMACLIGTSALTTLAWPLAARCLGKARLLGVATAAQAAAFLTLLVLGGAGGAVQWAALVLAGAGFSGTQVLSFAMLSDLIQRDRMDRGIAREGGITGLWIAAEKAGLAIGPMVGGGLLSAIGFVEAAGGASQGVSVRDALGWTACLVPAGLMLASLCPLYVHQRQAGVCSAVAT